MSRLIELEDVQNQLDRLAADLRGVASELNEEGELAFHVDNAIGAMGAASALLSRAQELAEVRG